MNSAATWRGLMCMFRAVFLASDQSMVHMDTAAQGAGRGRFKVGAPPGRPVRREPGAAPPGPRALRHSAPPPAAAPDCRGRGAGLELRLAAVPQSCPRHHAPPLSALPEQHRPNHPA